MSNTHIAGLTLVHCGSTAYLGIRQGHDELGGRYNLTGLGQAIQLQEIASSSRGKLVLVMPRYILPHDKPVDIRPTNINLVIFCEDKTHMVQMYTSMTRQSSILAGTS